MPTKAPRTPLLTRAALTEDLRALGLGPGDAVLVHAALSRVGPLLNGPDAVIGALLDAVGPTGTVLAYADWDARYEDLLDADGTVPAEWRPHVPPFDPERARCARDHGVFPEFLRTTPGARRSGNPGASVVALGAQAEALTRDHPLDYGYGPRSPFGRLCAQGGKVLMLGAPWDTMTLIHHAEHLANLPHKRVIRVEVPFATPGGVEWRPIEEFNTRDPVVAALDDRDYFTEIVTAFVATGAARQGKVGQADCLLVPAAPLAHFAVAWLETHGA